MGQAKPCRYCGNPVAPNAKTCPACGGKRPYPVSAGSQLFGGAVVLAVLGFCLWSGVLSPSKSNPPQSPSRSGGNTRRQPSPSNGPLVGSEATLSAGGEVVLLGVDRDSYDRLIDLAVARDMEGISLLVLQGKAFSVEPGTKCRVIGIESAFLNILEVRILEGGHYAESGIVAGEFVHR